jgi:hypothetical protein
MAVMPRLTVTLYDALPSVLTYIDDQFTKLDRATVAMRRDAIHLACRVAAGRNDAYYAANLRACIEAGLYNSPAETLADDLRRVIEEVTNG